MVLDWKGVFPAMITPFLDNDRLDFDLFSINLKAQLIAGVSGVVIGGSLGEASTLERDEKKELVRLAAALCADKVPVIMNIGEGSLREAIELLGNEAVRQLRQKAQDSKQGC